MEEAEAEEDEESEMVCVQSSIELPTPELDFDAQVIEYSLSRTKMQQGALWMEGRSQPFSLAPGGLEGAAGELFVEVKIVDIPTEEDLEEMKAASETASRSSLPSTGTTRSAKVALPPPRRGAPPRPTDPPTLMEVHHCWHAQDHTSKWQLVHQAAQSPGEVSSLINEVCRRPRGRSSQRPRLGSRVGTPR